MAAMYADGTAGGPERPTTFFDRFETCACGHSSAWHSGAWNAWRAGQQVTGGCEHGREAGGPVGTAPVCGCLGFRRPLRRFG